MLLLQHMKKTPTTTKIKAVFKLNVEDDTFKAQHLPKATGEWPFHLDLSAIPLEGELTSDRLVFNMVGDTGSVKEPEFQRMVAAEITKQYIREQEANETPQFLFHLGDIVYNFGEAEEYAKQFFEPYDQYPSPIFAIAGNHDADINPNNPIPYHSLDAFMRVFCEKKASLVPFSGNSKRSSMIQPNVYWTLKTPLANFICLYSNVPKFGLIRDKQKEWLIGELQAAANERSDKLMIICVHHSPYSADSNHGSSKAMIEALEEAYLLAKVKPDVVFSGHVHNYQRLIKRYQDGTCIPHIIAGAGGYADLHQLASDDDPNFTNDDALLTGVKLLNSCVDKHGFLKVTLEKSPESLFLKGLYYTIPHEMPKENQVHTQVYDRFEMVFSRKNRSCPEIA